MFCFHLHALAVNCVRTQYVFSGVQMYVCIGTQRIWSHNILPILFIYSDIDFK